MAMDLRWHGMGWNGRMHGHMLGDRDTVGRGQSRSFLGCGQWREAKNLKRRGTGSRRKGWALLFLYNSSIVSRANISRRLQYISDVAVPPRPSSSNIFGHLCYTKFSRRFVRLWIPRARERLRGMSGKKAAWDWKEEVRNGGSLREVELEKGVNGWASPPGDLFAVRGASYFSKKQKVAGGEWLMKPLGMDWLRSGSKLENVLGRPDSRVMRALRKAQAEGMALKAFVFAVNLQVPGREHYNAIFYYATEDPVPPGSLFYRFIHEDDAFRNSRFKLINRVVKGPWIVRATVGNHAACLLGKALTCHYLKGENYLEIDVDIGSSALANAIIHLALGYVTSVSVDMAFMVESQSEEELPERLLGAVRIAQIDMASAVNMDSLVEREQNERAAATGAGTGGGFEWRRLGRGLHPKVSGQAKNAKVEDGREGKN